ncbi:PAS domain S-box protein [Pseudodesulfovibrio sp.]|uniref:PAS domain S-box protein n=1 Tax=Pseudodesulfovibrio sp. TaxID=2035812 RepID=UPI00261D766D|nr:PAS domain S-box protein [Pseudodesulfovibrio sp.]MDD3310533.1 PAS domain S-box protein [Pseudodesulfovibrio sp.]
MDRRRTVLALSTLAALLLLATGTCIGGEARGNAPEHKEILLLNSYHQNLAWTESIFRGVTDVLRPGETGIVLHVENMDTKRVAFNEHYVQQLRDVYLHKYRDTRLSLVMATDDNAFAFLRRYHGLLFPGVPVVFCGVNHYSDELLRSHPLFTGAAESLDVRGTLWWALKQHAGVSTVYVVHDYSPSGRAAVQAMRQDLESVPPRVAVRYSGDLGLEEILAEVDSLPRDAIILYGFYYRDPGGRFYNTGEALDAIAARTGLPIYGLYDFDLGHGIVGGLLTSGREQGQAMAQLALHVLAGRPPRDIPVIDKLPSAPMFDYEMLRKHGIDPGSLPEGSRVINRPRSFYSEYGALIWVVVGFGSVQMMVILALVVSTSRRRQAEKALRGAHQLLEERVRERTGEVKETVEALRTVFDASHDAIVIHDVAGHILDVNERMLQMYGLTRDEIRDISIARDISSRSNAVYRLSSVWRSVINGEAQFYEWKARRPHDGSEFDVEVYLNRIVYHGREAILSNVRDISVRKESENRIRQSLSKFEAILENSLMGIAMHRKRTFVTINRRGAEIFGYSPEELIGNDVSVLFDSAEEVEEFASVSRRALSESGEFNTEHAFRGRNDNVVWCRMYAKALDRDSLGKGIIWAWDDITEQRRSREELMRAREDAEAANRAKSEFLAAMSHEIRTPMNAIVGMTDITLQTDLSEDQRDYLKTVMDSAQHLLAIINDILDLSKIEARKLTLDRVDFDLPYHVGSTIKGLAVQARQKGLSLVLDVADGVPRCVKGDPLSLRQVLVNLVGNAIKFTHRGEVAVRVFPAGPGPDPDDSRTLGVSFEVEDTGIGIPEDFLETIFLSFSQTTRAFGGTGLGLAICKQLISLMGGDIGVKSRVGAGSTFAFTIRFEPGVTCPAPVRSAPSLPRAPRRPVRLLVAEDNDVNVMVTTLRLEVLGYRCVVARNGLEVLDMVKREHFDLILMDIEMPVLDGISATKAIRSSVPGGSIPNPDIPIVGVTAHALKEFRDKSLDAGMDDYVSKPVDFNELAVIITRLVGSVPPPAGKARAGAEGADAPETPDSAATPEALGSAATPEDREAPAAWDPDRAMARLGVDKATFEGFLHTAGDELAATLEELRQAVGRGELVHAATLAGAVRSISASIGAHQTARAAARLAEGCRAGDSGPLARLQAMAEELLERMKNR